MSKTAQLVKEEFRRKGESIADWSKRNGFPYKSVVAVLAGHNKGCRGLAHRISVALELKDSPE